MGRKFDVKTYRDYTVTYQRPTAETPKEIAEYVRGRTIREGTDGSPRTATTSRPTTPSGSRRAPTRCLVHAFHRNGYNKQTAEEPLFVCLAFGYGYADNVPNTDKGATIDIDWAIDKSGKPVHLPGVDFVRVQTGVLQINGWIGENSTEFAGIQDLHVLKEDIPTK